MPSAVDSNGTWSDHRQFLSDVSQSCDDMIIECSYGGTEYACNQIFYTVLTDEGLCCIFNGVHQKFLVQDFQ